MRGVMRGRVRGAALGAVVAALVMGVVTGCSAGAGPDPVKNAGGSAAEKTKKDEDEDNDKGGSVGAPGSPCPMPVTFDLVADWKPEAVEPAADDEFAGLLEQGPVSLVCEIDAKPAGNIGFIRVWVGADAGDDTRKVLEAFVADAAVDRRKEAYTETKAGTFDATEVSYVNTGEFLDEPRKERAFAVATPKGMVVVDLGGSDSEEHEQMLPAYELARKTLRSS